MTCRRTAGTDRSLQLEQGRLEVRDQVLGILDPDGESDQPVLESGAIDVFQFAPGTTTITVGGTTDLALTISSEGTPITNLLTTFTSSDETIATVDPFTGLVTGLVAGTTTITASTGTLTTDVDITVE